MKWPAVLAVAVATLGAVDASAQEADPDERPNVIVVDDRRSGADRHDTAPTDASPDRRRGRDVTRSFVSYPVCCPSRATFLTGQYAHNNDVHCLYPWCGGGYGRLNQRRYLPVWLKREGVRDGPHREVPQRLRP